MSCELTIVLRARLMSNLSVEVLVASAMNVYRDALATPLPGQSRGLCPSSSANVDNSVRVCLEVPPFPPSPVLRKEEGREEKVHHVGEDAASRTTLGQHG